MATKKKHSKVAPAAAAYGVAKCRRPGCHFNTVNVDDAERHQRTTGHSVSVVLELSTAASVALSPAAQALKDAQTISGAVQDLRMWVDALANALASVAVPPAVLNELLVCTARMGGALDEAAPAAEEAVKLLRKVERRERSKTERAELEQERQAEAAAELAMNQDEVGHD
ncbi:hypothetical protein NR798_24225 [Archangium gephyra]|uniref:hypothetical protein n=1 Tax=Archangium gephyra TaxID=48 RepID=UPI0035D4F346